MAGFESMTFPFGSVKRRRAAVTSPTLLALPESARPVPILACATCHCAARRYVSWQPKQKAITLCDDREAALAELEAGRQDGPA